MLLQMQFRGITRTLLSRPIGFASLAALLLGAFVLSPKGNGPSMCGMQRMTGLPCPGCGLTRSVTSVLHGHFAWAISFNPFGLFFVAVFAVSAATLLLPGKTRERLSDKLRAADRFVGWMVLAFCFALLAHGIWRMGMIVGGDPDYAWWRNDGKPPFVLEGE